MPTFRLTRQRPAARAGSILRLGSALLCGAFLSQLHAQPASQKLNELSSELSAELGKLRPLLDEATTPNPNYPELIKKVDSLIQTLKLTGYDFAYINQLKANLYIKSGQNLLAIKPIEDSLVGDYFPKEALNGMNLALAQLYRPEAGDTVLALGGREYYVVGVLAGAGRMVVNAPGDLELRARGAVEIHGARGVRLRGPEVALTADRFTIAVRTVVERAARVYRAATELLHVRARRTRTVVDEECALAAREITARAGADLKLDGEKIHLG